MKKYLILILILIILLPMVYIILLSMFTFFKYPLLFPTNFTVDYWIGIFVKNTLFLKSLLVSILLGIVTGVFSTIIGFMTGRAIESYFDISDNKFVRIFISMPLFIPSLALFLGMHQVLLKTSLTNNIIGVFLCHTVVCIPYSTNIAISYYKGISKDMEDVSKTLGATSVDIFLKVILPILKPGILLSFSICFLISNTEYFSVFLIGGGNVISLSMLMYPFVLNNDYGFSSVTGIVFIILNLSVFITSDYFIKKSKHKNTLYNSN